MDQRKVKAIVEQVIEACRYQVEQDATTHYVLLGACTKFAGGLVSDDHGLQPYLEHTDDALAVFDKRKDDLLCIIDTFAELASRDEVLDRVVAPRRRGRPPKSNGKQHKSNYGMREAVVKALSASNTKMHRAALKRSLTRRGFDMSKPTIHVVLSQLRKQRVIETDRTHVWLRGEAKAKAAPRKKKQGGGSFAAMSFTECIQAVLKEEGPLTSSALSEAIENRGREVRGNVVHMMLANLKKKGLVKTRAGKKYAWAG